MKKRTRWSYERTPGGAVCLYQGMLLIGIVYTLSDACRVCRAVNKMMEEEECV
jgi:hypothetical protein